MRIVVLLNAVALNLIRVDTFDHPVAAMVCIAAMTAWTGVTTYAYANPDLRGTRLLVADLTVAVGLMLVSPLVKGDGLTTTVPGFWVMGALIAWAIHYQWRGGLFASLCLVAADLAVRERITEANYGNLFLLLVGGPIIGFLCQSLQLMANERDAAQREVIAETERARLARAVHDGVLQVLSLVQRRGEELGGDAAELGRLAGEQESVLRTLIRSQDAVGASGAGTVDLVSALGGFEVRPGVSVATPVSVLELPVAVVAELVAVVSACLDNVVTHVGVDAPAWVLVESLPDRVEISVRDEGPGIPEGRLDEAAAQGRLGVSESICGRVRDLGGTAELTTGSFGTEWEFVVPRPTRKSAD